MKQEQIAAVAAATITDAGELPALLTVAQVARFLQVSVSVVYLWIEKELIPFRRLPGTRTIRIEKGELLEWLAREED